MVPRIRPATAEDALEISRQRVCMFADMGFGTAASREAIFPSTVEFIKSALQQGFYRGWVAETDDGEIVAGGGVLLALWPPSAIDGKTQRPYIINMYTHPAYRRQGLAHQIMNHILEFLRAEGFSIARLNASEDGQSVYESLGFHLSNEMVLPLDSVS
jgi:ribosomal protein S18 acetylase RimI-like enzyme